MNDLIQEKLKDYNCQSQEDEENALKKITQELALYCLMKTGFFEKASFQGGTCLRIVYGQKRFPEDLDFALLYPDVNFDINSYLMQMAEMMKVYGYQIEIRGEDHANHNVRSRLIKDDSINKLLYLKHHADYRKKIQIKIELDVNPPGEASFEINYLDFPTDFMIKTMDIPSLFAGKCHALLCRNYVKGRDWFDYLWYLKRETKINFLMLKNALFQFGPWKNQNIEINLDWLITELENKIIQIDWQEAKKDVERFLRSDQMDELTLWSRDFFLKKTKKISRNK